MQRNALFYEIIKPIYQAYMQKLKNSGGIDFDDMIHRCLDCVKSGAFASPYKYIIIDEYQDISISRFKLIESLKTQNNAKLFCFGDDFQSIYQFAGSSLGLFTHFEKYFGYTEKIFILTTYLLIKALSP